jgi:hypothetical protein
VPISFIAQPIGTCNTRNMKTTLDLPDPLLREVRKIAARERTTLRALVEQGVRKIIAD